MTHRDSQPSSATSVRSVSHQEKAEATVEAVWRVQIQAVEGTGRTLEFERQIPAVPAFEAAFGAFARGTLLQTENAPIAIEDVLPGDRLITSGGRLETVLWVGKLRYTAQSHVSRKPLVRLMPDAFGLNRPENNTILGPYARVLHPAPGTSKSAGPCTVVTPARAFVDGSTVVEALPPTEVQLYHLSLRRHAAVIAGGMAVETYHPGLQPLKDLSQRLRPLFPKLFPHVSNLIDFGPLQYTRSAPSDWGADESG